MQRLMLRLGMEEDVPIESGLITKRIAAAQKAVETQNFEARKHLLEYDDVMNKQRQAVYGMRRQLLEGLDQKERIQDMIRGIVNALVTIRCLENEHPDKWDLATLRTEILSQFGHRAQMDDFLVMRPSEVEESLYEQLLEKYNQKEELIGAESLRYTERMIMLQVLDDQWKDHLLSMDHLKEGIGLRGYGQKDPLVEYKKESYQLFEAMMDRIEDETIRYLFFLQVVDGPRAPQAPPEEPAEEEAVPALTAAQRNIAQTTIDDFTRNIQRKKDKEMAELQYAGGDSSTSGNTTVRNVQKVGRNDTCPCGSGKKFKKCHGA
jgi:preprotein translocase subunit SecA